MHLVTLLGAGASVPAGIPGVREITSQVLSGENVRRSGSDFHLFETPPPQYGPGDDELRQVLDFVRDPKHLCDRYFESQDEDRVTNYEDIAYVARQISDGILSEYENPALLHLNERYADARGRSLDDLGSLADSAADYVQDVVRDMVSRPAQYVGYLAPIVDAWKDTDMGSWRVATRLSGPRRR